MADKMTNEQVRAAEEKARAEETARVEKARADERAKEEAVRKTEQVRRDAEFARSPEEQFRRAQESSDASHFPAPDVRKMTDAELREIGARHVDDMTAERARILPIHNIKRPKHHSPAKRTWPSGTSISLARDRPRAART